MRVAPRVWIGFAVALAFAVLLTTVQLRTGTPGGDDERAADAWLSAVLPLAVAAVLLVAGLSLARWWTPVLVERPRSPHRFPAIAPGMLLLAAVINLTATDWGAFGTAGVGILLVWGILVAFCSELVFRGILLVTLRTRHREVAVWLLSTALFAVVQGLVGLVGTGVLGADLFAAVGQIGFAFLLGTCLYIARRVTGNLVWVILLHAVWTIGATAWGAAPAAEPIGAVVAGIAGVAALLAVPWVLRTAIR